MSKDEAGEAQYRERIYPRLGTLFVGALFIIMISIAYAAAINVEVGVLIFLVGIIGMFLGLWLSSPVISISGAGNDQILSVGQASIPLHLTTDARLLNADELVAIQRGLISATAFVTTRGNLPSVALSVTDPTDPHDLWVMSSRTPKILRSHLDPKGHEMATEVIN